MNEFDSVIVSRVNTQLVFAAFGEITISDPFVRLVLGVPEGAEDNEVDEDVKLGVADGGDVDN